MTSVGKRLGVRWGVARVTLIGSKSGFVTVSRNWCVLSGVREL